MKQVINLQQRFTEHFMLKEFLVSSTAEQHKIPNIPLKCHITAMENLAVRSLEPTRVHIGLPILITSGYRCPQLNHLVGGADNSQHTKGEAADITIPKKYWPFCYTSEEQIARLLFVWMKDNLDLDQLILEHNSKHWWVHISCRVNFRHNRHQVINNLIKR